MTNHTGDWWLRETTPGTGTCTAAESDFTNKRSCGTGFRTGNATNGYALHSVTAKFRSKIGNPGSLGVNLYTSAGNDLANLISNATLSGSNPDTAGEYIYTCSGAGCSLSKDTTYFVVMTATAAAGRNIYLWQSANWDGETKIPSSNGWSIANGGKEGSAPPPIGNLTDASMMKIAATVNVPPSLTASGISGTGATLTIANDTGDWYYSASHPLATIPATTSPPAPDDQPELPDGGHGLHPYKAYDKSGCNSPDEIDTASFTTAVTVSNLGKTLAGQRDVGNWGNNATGRRDWANGFTTGSNTGGYTLRSVTAKFGNANGLPDALTVAIYDDSSGAPVSSVATLSGDSAPTTADDYIYTGSTDCDLGAGAAYHVALSVNFAQSAYYDWSRTASNDETNTSGNAGWSIADNGHRKVGGWTTYGASSLSED